MLKIYLTLKKNKYKKNALDSGLQNYKRKKVALNPY